MHTDDDAFDPGYRSQLVKKILESAFVEDYEVSADDLAVYQIAAWLAKYVQDQSYSEKMSAIRKSKSYLHLHDIAEEFLSLLSELTKLPTVGPALAEAFALIQIDASPTSTLPPRLEQAYDLRLPVQRVETLEYPELHLLEFMHSLECAVESLGLAPLLGQTKRRGAPKKDIKWLIYQLKTQICSCCTARKPSEVAGIIKELLDLIELQIEKKTILNILGSR